VSADSVAATVAAPDANAKTLSRFTYGVVLTLILAASFLIKLNHLGHASLKGLDESFHAVVAKNLIAHPLRPTLIDRPWLPYDYTDWQNNHIWLHKPIVPLWQMAASMAVLGVNTLTLRLPSAILATSAVWLTYALGVELLGRRAALIAAALQAFNPAITLLVHGYVFSDHVDVAFLFWVELSIYLLIRAIKSASIRWIIAAGVAQGIAYHCKTYPAFVVAGLAAVTWFLPRYGFTSGANNERRLAARHLLAFATAALLTILPWTIWCAVNFPREFAWEQLQVFRHLGTNVEGWAAPWDRLLFDFSLRIYHVFYPAVLVAAVMLLPRAWRERNLNLALLFAWALGVLIPFTLATSKTPTATLIGWPPFLLLLGAMIDRALRGDAWCLGAWAGATIVGALWPGKFPSGGAGYPNPARFAGVLLENVWVVWHLLIALATAAIVGWALCRQRRRALTRTLITIAALASTWLAFRMARVSYAITNKPDRDRPSFVELGAVVRAHLPANAVLLLEIRQKCEHVMAMFHTDRTVYPVSATSWTMTARDVAAAGGLPLLVTERELPLPRVLDQPADGLHVYAIQNDPPGK
jgi:4-amino-4-deoxy-L-arabinose transferase-like glycosyltransferase